MQHACWGICAGDGEQHWNYHAYRKYDSSFRHSIRVVANLQWSIKSEQNGAHKTNINSNLIFRKIS